MLDNDELDELFYQSVQLIKNDDTVNHSLFQRELHIGYNRAVRIIDQLDIVGLITQAEDSSLYHVNVSALSAYLKSPTNYLKHFFKTKTIEKENVPFPYYDDVLDILAQNPVVSTSLLQRRLKIEYSLALGIIKSLEKANYIQAQGSKTFYKVLAFK